MEGRLPKVRGSYAGNGSYAGVRSTMVGEDGKSDISEITATTAACSKMEHKRARPGMKRGTGRNKGTGRP
jgi:hypothetical protein